MKVAIIGSKGLVVLLSRYIPAQTTEIISDGERGVGTYARMYAETNGINYREFLPKYDIYGKKAPLIRDKLIINAADLVIAFWDGESRGTKHIIDRCLAINKPIIIYRPNQK